MYNAVIQLVEMIFAVQIDPEQMEDPDLPQLLEKLEAHFPAPVALVAWDENSKYINKGFPCPEHMVTNDAVEWRKFELPPEPEMPF